VAVGGYSYAMESDRNRAITNLKLRILLRENDKMRLQAVIAILSIPPERRRQALADLEDLLQEMRVAADELARLEAKSSYPALSRNTASPSCRRREDSAEGLGGAA
jgi:hypothetical protein